MPAVGIARHGLSWPVLRRPGGEGGLDSAPPSQVQATLRHPAASGRRAGRAARSLAREDLICLAVTHRSCIVEISHFVILEVQRLNMPSAVPAPRMVRYAFRARANRVRILSRAENISSVAAAGWGSLRAVLVSFT